MSWERIYEHFWPTWPRQRADWNARVRDLGPVPLGPPVEELRQPDRRRPGLPGALAPADVNALFVVCSYATDIEVRLTAKITTLAAATGRKHTGLQAQKEGVAGLKDLSRRITATMKELRPLMVRHLRDNDPKLLAVWKAAARSYRRRGAALLTEPPPEPGSGGGSGSGTTPPPSGS